jgi:hypothetical protein
MLVTNVSEASKCLFCNKKAENFIYKKTISVGTERIDLILEASNKEIHIVRLSLHLPTYRLTYVEYSIVCTYGHNASIKALFP